MKSKYQVYAWTLLALSSITAACNHRDAEISDNRNSEIQSFEIKQSVKTLERDYICEDAGKYYDDSIPVYSTVKIAVEWPEILGDYDITNLKESLLNAVFDTTGISIDDAMMASASRPEGIDLFKMKRVDSIPMAEVNRILSRDRIASVITFSKRFLVYQIMTSTYNGGAHGITESSYLNYDLKNGRKLTASEIFRDGSQDAVLQAVKECLMTKFNVSSMEELQDKGIFTDSIYATDNLYLQGYDIVFHYNPYDIAPYSMGSINVHIPYYQIQSSIRPEIAAMLQEAAQY